jgi:hypothetical protein
MIAAAEDKWIWPESEQGVNAKAGWQESHWWGLWGPKRTDEWADAYLAEYKVPMSDRRAGEDEATAAAAKQVAARARQQRWRETEQQRLGIRATKRAKAVADKERARRLREILDPTRPGRPKGWTRRLTDRAVLHWGAKRDLIKRMTNVSAKSVQVAVVIAVARASLTRVQKKRQRRYARLNLRAGVKPPEHAPGPGKPPNPPGEMGADAP